MKKNLQILGLLISLLLVACGGGGSGSSSGGTSSPTTVGNFTQLTPNGGVMAPQPSTSQKSTNTLNPLPPYDYFTTMSLSNHGVLYAGTAYGYVYQISNATSGFNNFGLPIITPDPKGNSIISFGANQNSYAYTTLNESDTIRGESIVPVMSNSPITAITLAANGITYYGTLDGQIQEANDGKYVEPFSGAADCSIDPAKCPVTAIGLTSNNAASGKKGVAALQIAAESIPVFNANQAESGIWAVGFNSAVACLEQEGPTGIWVPDSKIGIPTQMQESFTYSYTNENGQQIESSVTRNIPQFITTMLASTDGMIYVGTNLFNIYQTTGCNAGWTQINTIPLGTVKNGSVGVSSIGLVDNQLFVVTNNSESVVNLYQYSDSI